MTKASDNEFPSILFEEQASAPTTPASGFWRAYFKSDGLYVVDDAGTEVGPLAESGGGGGGLTHAFAGYNTAGSSWIAPMISTRNYIKSITLASAGFLASVGAHIRANRDDVSPLYAAVWADSAGSPTDLLAGGGLDSELVVGNSTSGFPDPGYWIQIPVGVYLPAGTYWIGVRTHDATVSFDLAYDTTASDKTFDSPASGNFHIHANHASVTVNAATSQRWSLRASILS